MSATITSIIQQAPPAETRSSPVKITRQMFHSLGDSGLLQNYRRCELIEGAIVEKMSQKQPHRGILLRWFRALVAVFGMDYVASQMPFVLSEFSEPEPDIQVTTRSNEHYLAQGETPPAEDIRLIVEISVATLASDISEKTLLYARGGIPDYWVIDVVGRRLIVHREPTAEGYASVVSYAEEDSVSPLAAPGATFAVVDFLP